MLNFKKTMSGVLAAAMVTAGFTTAMAAEEAAVKLLQYEDFNYNASADLHNKDLAVITSSNSAGRCGKRLFIGTR